MSDASPHIANIGRMVEVLSRSMITSVFLGCLQLSFAFVFICYRKLSWYRVCLLVFSFLKEMENKMRNTLNDIYFGKTKDIVNSLR